MKEIRAFVGHSFSAEDRDVVQKFLQYFENLSGTLPHFSFESASSAEPKLIADKVLGFILNKNVFIGICTRNELTINGYYKKVSFLSELFRLKRWDTSWKTSDWIIQEIGLAIGKELDIVLLIEKGVRSPGGLQGDIEHIEFERDAPEKSFNKVLEMIKALSPRAKASLRQSTEISSISQQEDESGEKPLHIKRSASRATE